jgi:porin
MVQDPLGRAGDVIGIGASWANPSPAEGFRNETLLEIFYRIALSPSIDLTPDLQIVFDPAYNEQDDLVFIPGVRLAFRF